MSSISEEPYVFKPHRLHHLLRALRIATWLLATVFWWTVVLTFTVFLPIFLIMGFSYSIFAGRLLRVTGVENADWTNIVGLIAYDSFGAGVFVVILVVLVGILNSILQHKLPMPFRPPHYKQMKSWALQGPAYLYVYLSSSAPFEHDEDTKSERE